MPIEIRELIIRARVEDQPGTSPSTSPSASPRVSEGDIQKIVALCAEEVLKVLKKQKER